MVLKMKTRFASAILLASLILARAEMQTAIPLWPAGAPGALGAKSSDIPTLTPYLPEATNATGTALVICPRRRLRGPGATRRQ